MTLESDLEVLQVGVKVELDGVRIEVLGDIGEGLEVEVAFVLVERVVSHVEETRRLVHLKHTSRAHVMMW